MMKAIGPAEGGKLRWKYVESLEEMPRNDVLRAPPMIPINGVIRRKAGDKRMVVPDGGSE